MLNSQTRHYLRLVYQEIVNSVKPRKLVNYQLKINGNKLNISNQEYILGRNCYAIGFGKAVYDMASEVRVLLKEHLQKCVISIPEGSFVGDHDLINGDVFNVFYGAKDNIPDVSSFKATQEIVNLVKGLNENDLLLVLISGGGSALLTYPRPPLTIEEKTNVIKLLSRSGADIKELNTVRKQLSLVKGGRLAEMAYPCMVVSLILSDVINDPLDIIASGPTVQNEDKPNSGFGILKKYSLLDKVPKNALQVLSDYRNDLKPYVFEKTQNVIIGNNTRALTAGRNFIKEKNRGCCILSTSVDGLVSDVADALAILTKHICQFILGDINEDQYKKEVSKLNSTLSLGYEPMEELNNLLLSEEKELFLLFGGETTVEVLGTGKGGRNMELALRFSLKMNELFENCDTSKFDIALLSAGTDGIDGPTDAAGAIAYLGQTKLAKQEGLEMDHFISQNDSYNFFKNFNRGNDLVITGHTGTNVMDINILYIKQNI